MAVRDGIYQAGFEWIDAGLDVAFDADSRREYRAFADAPPEARAAAIGQSEFADRAANKEVPDRGYRHRGKPSSVTTATAGPRVNGTTTGATLRTTSARLGVP